MELLGSLWLRLFVVPGTAVCGFCCDGPYHLLRVLKFVAALMTDQHVTHLKCHIDLASMLVACVHPG